MNEQQSTSSHISDVDAEVRVDSEYSPEMIAVTKMISKLSVDMRLMFSDVNVRISKLEDNPERKLTAKFNQIVDKRLGTEMAKMRKEMDNTVDDLRKDLDQDLKLVEEKL